MQNPLTKEKIDAFVKHADQVVANYWKLQGFTFSAPPTHRAEYLSQKWCRINVVENGLDKSVYAFICLQDGETKALGKVQEGDIHKAAGWKAPAKHKRGSIFDEKITCATPYGIVYLR